MKQADNRPGGRKWLHVSAAGLALLIKLALALFTVGTNDSVTWDRDLVTLKTAGFEHLYREGVEYCSPSGWKYPRQDFIHPPAVVNGLRGLGVLQDVSGLPLRFWLRVICALADVVTLLVVWMMFGNPRERMLLNILALSPISILISGFHANTDPLMICFVVVSVVLLERRCIGWSAVAFGLAAGIKLVPLIFLPAVLFSLPDLYSRAKWTSIAAATWILVCMPYVAQEPVLILKTILAYDSARGLWGLYFLSSLLKGTALEPVHTLYAPAAKWIALLAVVSLPLAMRVLRIHLSLFVQCGMIVFLFLLLSPGFGLQYLAWTVPFVIALGMKPTGLYHAVGGFCLLTVYTTASHGTSNFYADVFNVPMPMRILVRLICWVAIGVMVCRFAMLADVARRHFQEH